MKNYLEDLTDNLENKQLIKFVEWYLKGHKEKEWEKVKTELHVKMDSKKAMDTYLKRIDVQNAIVQASKITVEFDFIRVYRNMLDKALEGDQKSADWILRASNSNFFKNEDSNKDTLRELVKGLNLNE